MASRGRTYTIGYLLSHQPKTIEKHPDYRAMLTQYHVSRPLQHLRLNRRCYSLLHNARIAPGNLRHFYRTYRLPADPFFPLFFAIKRSYLDERERRKEERRRSIVSTMRALPPEVLTQIKYLGYLERHYNGAGRSPVWQSHLFPGSKKKADAYSRYTAPQWHALYRGHLSLLQKRYRGLTDVIVSRVLACFVLGIVPSLIPPSRPSSTEVSRTYRRLSLLHHPDRGGDPSLFISIKQARDLLVGAD